MRFYLLALSLVFAWAVTGDVVDAGCRGSRLSLRRSSSACNQAAAGYRFNLRARGYQACGPNAFTPAEMIPTPRPGRDPRAVPRPGPVPGK